MTVIAEGGRCLLPAEPPTEPRAALRRARLAYVTTVAVTQWAFLRGQNRYLTERGMELHAIASPSPVLSRLAERDGVTPHGIPISRRLTPIADVWSVVRLVAVLRRIRPDILHVSTPKAALLGSLAGWLAGVPIRLYLIRGLASEGARGGRRALYQQLERLTARLCHQTICVAPSLLEFARASGVLRPGTGIVIGAGMSNGIDAHRFTRGSRSESLATLGSAARRLEGAGSVVGFVGRLTASKGIGELEQAWSRIRTEFPGCHLLLVGPWEEENSVPRSSRARLEADPRVVVTGAVEDAAPFYSLMSLFVFPSHREGFPNAPMEAAAGGLAVIATRVVGCADAVVDGVTGRLVQPQDASALTDAMRQYLLDPALCERHGQAGRRRVSEDFRPEPIWSGIYAEYERLLEHGRDRRQRGAAAKRLTDVVAAALLLMATAPVLLAVAITLRARLGAPVLFRQQRPGLNGRPFMLIKFRTMRDRLDERGHPLPDQARLTRLGRLIRSTSLDELPQLWNVLRGEMSLVGPRPLLMDYLPLYSPEQRRRHEARPGLTGWAQVNGRNALSWHEKFKLDVWYVDNQSLWLDLKIVLLTIKKVVSRHGISQNGHATMEKFRGAR